ncbi:TPA: type IV secretory system conjugative DNA transfer family protein, partial [Escherichia coli]|nr:type IV secretory system conjugative DNA transfer family protein [Escherichia coli]
MKKKIILVVFLLLILVACLIGGNYLGGYAALKYSGLSIDMLQWNTFNNVITQFSGKP